MSKRYWTPSEDAAILRSVETDAVLSVRLGRSAKAVGLRRWKLRSGRTIGNRATGRPANTLADVWKFVAVGEPDECWPYTGAKRRRGYGAFALNKRSLPAHRAVFQDATGIDPGDRMVCHTCDNPPCCNPAHLFLGTATDNVHDMLSKGRARPPRGEQHHGAKLTVDQVREIRTRRAAGEKLVDIAREYDVGDARLSVIVNHPDKAWSHA